MKIKYKILAFFPDKIKLPTEPNAHLYGEVGEAVAVATLKKGGYKILKRNYKPYKNEIDIIAKRGKTVSFIEVKTRTVANEENPYFNCPSASVSEVQKDNIKACARTFLIQNKKLCEGCDFSYDIIEVFVKRALDYRYISKINHIKSAFK